jgi:hypothetical protein
MQFLCILLITTSTFSNTNPSVMPRDNNPNNISAATPRGGRGGGRSTPAATGGRRWAGRGRAGQRGRASSPPPVRPRGPPPQRLTVTEQEIVRRALQYWDDDEHWDFECPTLFGLERSELQSVRQSWPLLSTTTTGGGPGGVTQPTTPKQKEREQKERLAAIDALRELLLGASTPPKSQISHILGVNYDTACRLLDKVLALYTYNNN